MIDEAKFNRFSIAVQDFEKAAAFLAEAKNHLYGSLPHEALVFSAIICYFRPFTKNEISPDAPAARKLSLSDFSQLSEDELAIHKTCEDLRNKALAHAEIAYYPTRFDRETNVISSSIFSLVTATPDLDGLAHLAKKLSDQCHNQRADYVRAVRNTP